MKVTLTTSISGTRDGEDWPARGATIDLPDAEAVAMINAGLAAPAADEVEKADAAPKAERATRKR